MNKRAVIIVLVVFLIVFMAACSGGNSGGSGSNAGGQTSQSNSGNSGTGGSSGTGGNSDTKEPAQEPKPEPVEVSFTVLSNDGGHAYAKQAKKNDPFYDEMSRLFSEYIGQPTHINFEFVPADDYSQQLTVRFASKDVPEVVSSTSIADKGHPTAVENGVFLPLNDLIDQYGPNLKAKIPDYVWENPAISRDGVIYGIPKMLTPINPAALYVRADWLEKLNMKAPETLDEYLAFFEAVKQTDLNGNGQHDEIGYPMRGAWGFSNAFFNAFGLNPGSYHEVDGKFIPDIINPKMVEAVKFYKTLYDNGYIPKDFLTWKDVDWTNSIRNSQAAVWSHDLRNLGSSWATNNFNDPNVKVDVLPGFKQENGEYYLGARGLGVAKVFMIMSGTKNPERIVQWLDWTYSDDEQKNRFFNFGIEGRNYTVENGDIKWDSASEQNNLEKGFHQTMIYPGGDARMSTEVIEKQGGVDIEVIKRGMEYEEKNLWYDPTINMPALESMNAKPELTHTAGSLFHEMLAKAITGVEDVDTAFNNFVAEWKKRGGDAVIEEATAWYNSTKK
jgi:ABC-type glycerol-3-phosphate transport system substrate-binding protein